MKAVFPRLSRMQALALIPIALAFSLSACQSEEGVSSNEAEPTNFTTMTVSELRGALTTNKDFVLVNVHIPYAGELPETDLFIPYNEIEQNLDKLPADRNAKIVLYCRSGSMSNTAAKTLVGSGYTDVVDVPGGMNAWKAAGYALLQGNPPK